MDKHTRIIIAGAGIGGLVAAACLLQRGFRVQVLEQASELSEIGAGVQSSANAVKVLYSLGLGKELELTAVRPQSFQFRRYDTGEMLHSISLGDEHQRRHGAPYFHIHRADLHALLVRTVNQLSSDAIRLNARGVGFEESKEGVTLLLSDGRRIPGDVLIGADGIKSAIRSQILGETPATYTGDVAWRAVVPVERLPSDIMETVSTVWCGPKKHAVMYYLRARKLMNFVGLVEHDLPETESWTQKRPWTDLKAVFEGWHPTIQTVIDAIDKEGCYRYALNDRAPVSRWSTERVTLLGDAAHPTLPYLASGAAMAIEDGAVLARCLDEFDNPAEALGIYQSMRLDRTARVVRESAANRTLYRIEDEEVMRKAFHDKNMNKSRSEWLYAYDPLTVPLEPATTATI